MGHTYTHLTLEDRCQVAALQAAGHSIRQIAATLDRAPSSIARELTRNASATQGYRPGYADHQARARRWTGSKLDRDPALRATVLARLQHGWSPQQVAGRLAVEQARPVLSHETIYRFIYAQMARTTEYAWRHYLPYAKAKRGRRSTKGRSPAAFIAQRRPWTERPAAVADRQTPGHWEADLMLFRLYGQVILALHERHSRLLLAARLPGKAAAPIAHRLATLFAPLPPTWRQTVTFDNGTEFAQHHTLHALGLETFFCDPHAPWQKGGIENVIGRLRRTLPRKTDLATLSDERFTHMVQAYNNTPRHCLGYQTPAEVFHNHLLHFKCESTVQPIRE